MTTEQPCVSECVTVKPGLLRGLDGDQDDCRDARRSSSSGTMFEARARVLRRLNSLHCLRHRGNQLAALSSSALPRARDAAFTPAPRSRGKRACTIPASRLLRCTAAAARV